MKYLILLCSMLSISALRADTTQTVQTELVGEKKTEEKVEAPFKLDDLGDSTMFHYL